MSDLIPAHRQGVVYQALDKQNATITDLIHVTTDLNVEKALETKPMMVQGRADPKSMKIQVYKLLAIWNSTLPDKMSDAQVSEAAMLVWAEFRDLSFDEIALALQNIKVGRYKLSWSAMSPMKLCEALQQYKGSEERLGYMETRHKKHEEKRLQEVFQDEGAKEAAEAKRKTAEEYKKKILDTIAKSVDRDEGKGTSKSELNSYNKLKDRIGVSVKTLIKDSDVVGAIDLVGSYNTVLTEDDSIELLKDVLLPSIYGVKVVVDNGWRIFYFDIIGQKYSLKIPETMRGESTEFLIQNLRGWKKIL